MDIHSDLGGSCQVFRRRTRLRITGGALCPATAGSRDCCIWIELAGARVLRRWWRGQRGWRWRLGLWLWLRRRRWWNQLCSCLRKVTCEQLEEAALIFNVGKQPKQTRGSGATPGQKLCCHLICHISGDVLDLARQGDSNLRRCGVVSAWLSIHHCI